MPPVPPNPFYAQQPTNVNALEIVSGKVGIGTSSPTEKLTVSGNVAVYGDIYSSGQRVPTLIDLDDYATTGHFHGNITNSGTIGATSNQVVVTTTNGVLTTQSRSGIDTRTSFPNADVEAATDQNVPDALVRRDQFGNVGVNFLSANGLVITEIGTTTLTVEILSPWNSIYYEAEDVTFTAGSASAHRTALGLGDGATLSNPIVSGSMSIGSNAAANSKSILDLTSTTKGFLPPRMTTSQRNLITSVPAGLMIYNTSTSKLNFYNGTAWEAVTSA